MGGCPRMRECPSPWGSRRSAWVSPNSVLDSRPESRAFSMVGTAGGCPTISKVSRRRAGASMGVPEFPGWWVSRNFHVISNGWWVSLNSLQASPWARLVGVHECASVGGCPIISAQVFRSSTGASMGVPEFPGWWVSHNFRTISECPRGFPSRWVGVPECGWWVSHNFHASRWARLVGVPECPHGWWVSPNVRECPAMGGCPTIFTPQFSGFLCASGRVTLVPGWW